MELRQLRYFVKVCELGSMGRAALDLGLATSALSQQISRLEGELAARLLQRKASGVIPTEAGLAFLQQAQLTLRHADAAVHAAQTARLSGHVSIGLASTTASVLGVPLARALAERYPAVRLHLVEALSGHLRTMLHARQLDMAILFRPEAGQRWSVSPLLDEALCLISAPALPGLPSGRSVQVGDLADLPLILPGPTHGLRALIDASFARLRIQPRVVAQVDGLALLMDMVRAGLGATIQPSAAVSRLPANTCVCVPLDDAQASRRNLLASLPEEELSPAALAARVALREVVRALVQQGRWAGARLHEN